MTARPRITFDTSAINRLEDGGSDSVPLMRALELGYDVVLTAMSADEIIAISRNVERREALLRRFGWLLENAICIWPPNEVVRLHVLEYQRNPQGYDWNRVQVRAHGYEIAIPGRDFPDDIYETQRTAQFEVAKQFETAWKSLRPKLEEIIRRDPTQRLATFTEAAQIAVKDGGVLWGFGKGLFEHATKAEISEQEVRGFIEACPPFRAACFALVKAWFNFSLSPTDTKSARAGRNDLMMAAYLPYCDRFLTNDYAQHKDLIDIAAAADIRSEVTSFDQFSKMFDVSLVSADA